MRLKCRVGLAGGAFLLAAFLLGRAHRSSGVSLRSYGRIKLGMTEGEVDAIIGLPEGNYWWKPGMFKPKPFPRLEEKGRYPVPVDGGRGDGKQKSWGEQDYCIWVSFDPQGRVRWVGLFTYDSKLAAEWYSRSERSSWWWLDRRP
jgi:hypothetical protein